MAIAQNSHDHHAKQLLAAALPLASATPSPAVHDSTPVLCRKLGCLPANINCCMPWCILQDSFGSDSMLGPLDENDPDMASDDGAEDADAMEEDDELTAALARTHI
jgi:hypothetical protein